MDSVFDHLITAVPPDPIADIGAVWARHQEAGRLFDRTLDVALVGGFGADRLGFAFLSGYQEALRSLLPGLPAELAALCATEPGGAHPAQIRTTLTESAAGWVLNGTKSFATLGAYARRLIVVASVGVADGRNRLRVAVVDASAPGIAVTQLPPTPFAPEIPHATMTFTDAPAQPLPGDGYADYLKPFRTIEDAHVLAATIGWLVRVARESDWPDAVTQRLLAGAALVRGLDVDGFGRVPGVGGSTPGTHIALGGAFEFVERVLTELDPLWAQVNPDIRTRWERDRPLLATAGRVREQRLAAAWRAVRGE
ncbi:MULTISPECIES: acyl-CoA dehydrogenase family protein [unclassified Nocardia]|uniref:acyl-CoA dehydrogenase family protein n=1 Tax=unclassified Nocardia TaxID=2637762 RepID=UPI001CE45829|nr:MULTISPECIES: acyl-CoA dehydrogenase family protein [unclassified Nocardia]